MLIKLSKVKTESQGAKLLITRAQRYAYMGGHY